MKATGGRKPQRIVVTGGTGLIGRRLLQRLSDHGDRVFLLTRNPGKTDGRLPPNVDAVLWEPVGDFGWMQVVDGADAVINLAGEPLADHRWSRKQKARILGSRVGATAGVVEAIRRAKKRPSVMISGSAVGIYGNVPEGDLTEESPTASDFLAETCKRWEAEAFKAATEGVRVVTMRTGLVLESPGGALARMLVPYRFLVGGPIGSGQQWLSWVHIEDVGSAILFALEQDRLSGPVNLTSPEPVRMKEFAKTLGRVLHRPSIFRAPAIVVQMLYGERSGVLLGGQRVLPGKLQQADFPFRYTTLEPALRDVLSPG